MLDADKAGYIIYYYAHLMTPEEWRAYTHMRATLKDMWYTHLRSTAKATWARNGAAQLEAANSSHPAREALKLAGDELAAFKMRTAQRILDERSNEIAFNYCPRCGALARTPKARQCRFCRHDWHSA